MRMISFIAILLLFAATTSAVESLSVYDDSLNSNSKVSLEVNSSKGPAYVVIDLDKNQVFESDIDVYSIAKWTGGRNDSIYYKTFFGPFSNKASGEFKAYAFEQDRFAEGMNLEDKESVTVNIENTEPTLYNQSLERNGLNFTYTFSSSENMWRIFAPIYLNHSSHDGIFYKKLLKEDFEEISNNTFRSNFTVTYDGNYSVHVDRGIDYHENIGSSNITETFSVISISPVIEKPKPANNSAVNNSSTIKLSVYDRGAGLKRESLKATVKGSDDILAENITLDSNGLTLKDKQLTIHPKPIGFNLREEEIKVEIYVEDKLGNSARSYLHYPIHKDFIQKIVEFFSSII